MPVHHWASLSWPAFRALPAGRRIALLPMGALEAHGPHLPLGTDIVIAEAMARAGANRLSRRGFDVVLLPALPFAPAPFAAAFEGTIDTPPTATTALLTGIARSAARNGARATVVANAHHDPVHVSAIRDAVRQTDTDQSGRIIFPDLTRRRWASRLTPEFQSGACHAGRYEGSVILAAEPHLVDAALMSTLPANPRSLVDAMQSGRSTFADAGGPDAYFGSPAEATVDEGHEIIDRLGAILEEAVIEVFPAPAGDGAAEPHGGPVTPGGGLHVVNPISLGRPSGFSHGTVAPAGWRTLYVAGQTAADETGAVSRHDFAAQFGIALEKVLEVVRAAGGEPSHVARMTVYVTDLDAYRASRPLLAAVWSRLMDRHYPAMALVQVAGLVDRGATVEIQADAVLPPSR